MERMPDGSLIWMVRIPNEMPDGKLDLNGLNPEWKPDGKPDGKLDGI